MTHLTHQPLLAVIDLGSSSTKACLTQLHAPTGWLETMIWPTEVISSDDGQSEFEPAAIDALIEQIIDWLPQAANRVGGRLNQIAITGQVGGVLLLDDQGQLQRPALTWADRRGLDEAKAFSEDFGDGLSIELGHELPVQSCWSAPKIRRLSKKASWLIGRTSCVMQLPDYLYYRLTGLRQTAPTLALSLSHQQKHRYAQPVVTWAGLKTNQLPEIGSPVAFGVLSEALAVRWKHHRPSIVLAGADMFCAMVGLACRADDAFIQAGTTEIAGALMRVDEQPALPKAVIRLAIPEMMQAQGEVQHDRFPMSFVYGSTSNGGMSLTWLAKRLGIDNLDAPAHHALWDEAAMLDPDPEGIVFVPHVLGARAPRWRDDAQGGLIDATGQSLHRLEGQSPAKLLRSVLEGCAMSKRSVLEAVGRPRRQVVVAGGGTRRAMMNQVRADVLGLPVVARRLHDVAAAGAGALAVGGAYDGASSSSMPAHWLGYFHQIMGQDAFFPDKRRLRMYNRLYQRYLAVEQTLLP